ncbi:adenosylcobinamide-GDP ribazoletransferase [Uliginosibacterium aquaticum]|uniref:Adenosylcobinamide-GDP ribazoletransferase n=1 Tax=Uliginosibacterium aquaticum TaxID=2731212 RepID=A0ABX2IJN6_9RHOO|nr:adenosylcobinamide-GDP ribazoletransferase [Uliginosibacterium aquaticum]NSL56083.1 adenosylcobinamide-GDP ribazoletransferase [Uliginosibacterium aquaticum]
MTELRRLLIALGYFTRLPIPAWVGWSSSELNRATRYFPLVGLLVGLISSAALWTAQQFWPGPVAVLLAMLLGLLLTGAFHEDGLADSADGFGGGWETAKVLSIMKDSRIGTYGAIALVSALLLKYATLTALSASALLALPLAHALSRIPPLLIMAGMTYVREDDSTRAKPVAEGLGPVEWLGGSLLGLAPLAAAVALGLLSPVRGLALLIALTCTGLICARYFKSRIGGYTGDALGAAQQVCELTGYLVLCAHGAG